MKKRKRLSNKIQRKQLTAIFAIKKWLDDNNITQAEFARRINVSRQYITAFLRGRVAHFSCDTCIKIELVTKQGIKGGINRWELRCDEEARLNWGYYDKQY